MKMTNSKYIKFLIVSIIIFSLAAINFLLSDVSNFSPIAAMALFGGAYLKDKKIALLVPVLALFISDLFIGFHGSMWAVYLSFVFVVLMGTQLKKTRILNIFVATVLSSTLFFVLTNFAVWVQGGLYTKDIAGLIQCYEMGIPFFKNTILGDMIFSGSLFGLYSIAQYKFPVLKTKHVTNQGS